MGKANPYNTSNRRKAFEFSERPSRSQERDRDQERQTGREEATSSEIKTKSAYEVDEHPFELRHEVKRLNTRLDKIADSLEKADFKDIVENYMNPKKRMITNFTAGLSRGLGMTIGTFVVLGLLGYILSLFVDMPLIGDYIAELQGYIDKSK
ncbi:DUF5665 domain-containing protein [Paenibacillus dakarensis]|uniref:DUF5665 domain-containing protein n=1 Tax=Paenibacillus dakarensis TaxID=1527293 RepID=UPI000A6B187F|nr:DUF5665 domain-containing protein [Paenibacillus dakarensis]